MAGTMAGAVAGTVAAGVGEMLEETDGGAVASGAAVAGPMPEMMMAAVTAEAMESPVIFRKVET